MQLYTLHTTVIASLTAPLLSYFDGAGFSRAVEESFPADARIEDLWLRL
jgi:hypothetical protein